MESASFQNFEEMSILKNKIHERKIQLSCEAIKFSINLMIKIDDSIDRKIYEETLSENLVHNDVVYLNLKNKDMSTEKLNDLLIKIKMFLNIIRLVSKYLHEEIENSGETQQIYFSKIKVIVDNLISKLFTKSSALIKNMSRFSQNDNRKHCKSSDSHFACHKYSDSTLNSETGEHSFII
jgi:hypothetical protein